eukprot:2294976-Pyramimonas_sp.AAC.1
MEGTGSTSCGQIQNASSKHHARGKLRVATCAHAGTTDNIIANGVCGEAVAFSMVAGHCYGLLFPTRIIPPSLRSGSSSLGGGAPPIL